MPVIYESESVTIIHGDARDELPRIPKESVELIVSDPPYGQEWQSGKRADTLPGIIGDGGHERTDIHEAMRHAIRVLRRGRHLYVFGPGDILVGLDATVSVDLVWDKVMVGPGDLSCQWSPSWEPISFATRIINRKDTETVSSPARVRRGTVLRYQRLNSRQVKRHPTEKPVSLLQELIESSSRPGELVLDMYGGSMATGVAAVLSRRRAVLIEIDERYIRPGIERIEAAEALMVRASNL